MIQFPGHKGEVGTRGSRGRESSCSIVKYFLIKTLEGDSGGGCTRAFNGKCYVLCVLPQFKNNLKALLVKLPRCY